MVRLPLWILLVVNIFIVVFAVPGFFLFSGAGTGRAVDVAYLKGVTFGVMPLTDVLGENDRGKAITSILFSELEKLEVIDLVPPQRLASALAAAGVTSDKAPEFRQIIQAGRAVGADIMLNGTLNNYVMLDEQTSAISISLVAISVHSGKTVWSETLTRSFENTSFIDKGAHLACTILVNRMVEDMEKQKRAMKKTGDEFTIQPAAAVPTIKPAAGGPSVDSILADINRNNPDRRRNHGDDNTSISQIAGLVPATTKAPSPGFSTSTTPASGYTSSSVPTTVPIHSPRATPTSPAYSPTTAIPTGNAVYQASPTRTPVNTSTSTSTPEQPPAATRVYTSPTTASIPEYTKTPATTTSIREQFPSSKRPVPVSAAKVTYPLLKTGSAPSPDVTSRTQKRHKSSTNREHGPTGGIEIGRVGFASSSSALSEQARETLSRLIETIDRYPKCPIIVEGHTDASGTRIYNDNLALSRAKSVKRFLVLHGVAADRIVTFGYGARRPVDQNTTEAGKSKNRRAIIHIFPEANRLDFTKTRPATVYKDRNATSVPVETHSELGARARRILARIKASRNEDKESVAASSAARHEISTAKTADDPIETFLEKDKERYLERCKSTSAGLDTKRIRPGDALRVKVAGHDELDKRVEITPAGIFSYSLIDDFKATGKTIKGLASTVQKKLKKYILNASVNIKRIHLVKVLGEVRRQGQFEFAYPPTILDVLAQAQGINRMDERYNRMNARILVPGGEVYQIDVTKLLSSVSKNEKLRLFHGDTLIIEPEDRRKIYVLGAGSNAVLYRSGMRLLDALILANSGSGTVTGGPDLGDEKILRIKNVRILRKTKNGHIRKIVVNLHDIIHRGMTNRNISLQPGDYIIIPRRSKRITVVSFVQELLRPLTQAVMLKGIF